MPTYLLVALTAYDLAGLALGAVLLWRPFGRGGGAPPWWRDALAFLALGAALCAAAVVVAGAFLPHGRFAVLRLLTHGLFCVAAPLLVVRGAWRIRKSAPALGGALLAAGLSLDAAFVYALEVEPRWLAVTRYELASGRLEPGAPPIRVAVLADLQTDHVGDYERRVFRELDALRADLVLLPGDYLQLPYADPRVRERERLALVELFAGLEHRPRYGIFAVDGDADSAEETLAGSAARPLVDEELILPGDPPLQLIGLGRPTSRYPLAAERVASIERFPGLTIVMGHAPDFALAEIEAFEERGPGAVTLPALFVAGHTHGGQVVIPGWGPPITLTHVPRRYASGLHSLGALTLFVSRGVGLERGMAPRVRFNCRPELASITVRGLEPSERGVGRD